MILVAGLPASGKSTLAQSLAPNKSILEFDSLAIEYGSYADLNEERSQAERIFVNRIRAIKPSIVVDSFHSRMARNAVASILPFISDIIIVSCPIEVCLMRNMMRRSMVSNDEIIQMSMAWEPISLKEGYNAIYMYDSVLNVMKCIDRRK